MTAQVAEQARRSCSHCHTIATADAPGEGGIEGAGLGAWCGLGGALGAGPDEADPEMNSVLGVDLAPALWREQVLSCENTSNEKATQLGVFLQDSQQSLADEPGPELMILSVYCTPAVVAHGSRERTGRNAMSASAHNAVVEALDMAAGHTRKFKIF